MRNVSILAVVVLSCLCTIGLGVTQAAQAVRLEASFAPYKLGRPTTIGFGFDVSSSTPGAIPSPVTGIDLYLPAGMGLATSTLGLAACDPARLLALGLEGCPANARVGFGTARGELKAGGEVIDEEATVQAVLGPPINENEQVLFYVESNEPVFSQFVFPGELLPSSSPAFSGHLNTTVPLVPTWTDGPDIAVTKFSSTLGPRGLTYLRHRHGVVVPFHPRGISVPARCPAGGFPFVARLVFADGSRTVAHHNISCQ
ncbi:MAG: hypothetical protein ACHQHO_08780 [Solirubrobacterales bacterium]